jgi:hypothetical protein
VGKDHRIPLVELKCLRKKLVEAANLEFVVCPAALLPL